MKKTSLDCTRKWTGLTSPPASPLESPPSWCGRWWYSSFYPAPGGPRYPETPWIRWCRPATHTVKVISSFWQPRKSIFKKRRMESWAWWRNVRFSARVALSRTSGKFSHKHDTADSQHGRPNDWHTHTHTHMGSDAWETHCASPQGQCTCCFEVRNMSIVWPMLCCSKFFSGLKSFFFSPLLLLFLLFSRPGSETTNSLSDRDCGGCSQ